MGEEQFGGTGTAQLSQQQIDELYKALEIAGYTNVSTDFVRDTVTKVQSGSRPEGEQGVFIRGWLMGRDLIRP